MIEFYSPEGATPLNFKSSIELIPKLTNQNELNEFEQINISLALEWARTSRNLKRDLVSVDGIRALHRKMFERTWIWAGVFRQYETNIGVPWIQILEQLKLLCDDVRYWIGNKTFSQTETAIRLHHRLVSIHPFPNGNVRLSRLVADLFLEYQKHPSLSWGGSSLVQDSLLRSEYLAALKEADQGTFDRLIKFASAKQG
jgi:Fic-DOC domain mobile mystery protein B